MKIKVAVLDPNIEFMNRLARIFQQKYADRIHLSIFSNQDTLYQSLNDNRTDLVLFDQSVRIKEDRIPEGVTTGYLSAAADVDTIDGIPAICKYQKAEEIYKMMLNLYAEAASEVKLKKGDSEARIVLFASVQGGSGTSTAAAAYALKKSPEKKVFYLNLEKFGNANLYFKGEGKLSFSDVIYAIKSRKGNLAIKLESTVQTDTRGVDFFNTCRNAYDMFELSDEEIQPLIQGVIQLGRYEEIVIDISGDMTDRMLMLMRDYADRIVYVADGSITGNMKFERFCETVRVIEQRQNISILDKTCLLYNRFSSKSGVQLETAAVPVIGGLHQIAGLGERELSEKIAQKDVFDRI